MELVELGSAYTYTAPGVGDAALTEDIASASYTIYDQGRTALVATTTIDANTDHRSVTIAVPSNINQLADGVSRALVTIEVSVVLTSGAIKKFFKRYLLQADIPFVIPAVSFQTLEQAILLGTSLFNTDAWDGAADTARAAALTAAHDNIDRYRFELRIDRQNMVDFAELFEDDGPCGFHAFSVLPRLSHMHADRWALLPANFVEAICKAQVLEANDLLTPKDDTAGKRQAGITSETVGESSVTYIATKPLRGKVCGAALAQLRPYLASNNEVRRT